MPSKSSELFICPKCGGVSNPVDGRKAVCSTCKFSFSIVKPEKRAKKKSSRAEYVKNEVVSRNVMAPRKPNDESFPRAEEVAGFKELPKRTAEEKEAESKDTSKSSRQRSRRRKRRKKKDGSPRKKVSFLLNRWLIGLGIWVVVVLLVLSVVRNLKKIFLRDGGLEIISIEDRLSGDELKFYTKESPKMLRSLQNFLGTPFTAQKKEEVLQIPQLSHKISRFYGENPPRTIPRKLDPSPVFWNIAFEETPSFVEVVWNGSEEGFFEAVFMKSDGVWRLDWEHFVRYSDDSWTLFRQQIGTRTSGVFRVYLEFLGESDAESLEPWIRFRILSADPDPLRRDAEAGSSILLKKGAPLFTAVRSLFASKQNQSKGHSALWRRDPKNLCRATVRLAWEDTLDSEEKEMVLEEVISDNWRTLENQTGQSSEIK